MNKQVREKISKTLKRKWKEGKLHNKDCSCCICHPELHKSSSRMKGKYHSIIAKRKIAIATKKRWNNINYRQKVSNAISKSKIGIKFSKQHKENLKKNHSHSWKGKKHSLKTRRQISKKLMGHKGHQMKVKKVRHHIYKEENDSKIMYLTVSKHNSLHKRAYDYIYETQGKKGIDKYIKWFDKNFNLRG